MPKIPRVILLIETSRAYGRGLLYGIDKYSRLHGPWVFYREPQFYFKKSGSKETSLAQFKAWNATGIIARVPDIKKTKELAGLGLPMIVSVHLDGLAAGMPNIITDDDAIGKLAAEHLIERGFKNFAFYGAYDTFYRRGREIAFSKAVERAGFTAHSYHTLKRKSLASEKELSPLAKWLKSLPTPIGIMTCTDDDSQRIAEECKIVGRHVPEEVAILGVDNDALVCGLSDPPLSSIALNTERAGYEAAELLAKMMAGEKSAACTIIVHPTHVVTRHSTDILAIDDRDVAEAVRFIRRHSRRSIQVSDVVQEVPLSRRVLEQRFRKVLGRSILDEIKRVRTEQICRLLVETNMSVSNIASALGYSGVDHIARYFREEMKMSPLAYRKQFGQK